MKNIKLLISFIIILILSFSCTKDDESQSNYRIIEEIRTDGSKTTYSYTNNNQLNRITDDSGTTLGIYNSQGLLTNVNYNSASLNSSFDIVISYSPSGLRLQSITTYSNGSKEKSVYTEGNGVILKRDDFELVGGVWVSAGGTIYYDSNKRVIQYLGQFSNSLYSYDTNGNCIEIKNFEKQTNGTFLIRSKTIFEYDDKKNRRRINMDDDYFDPDDNDHIYDKNKNNIKSNTFINYKPDGLTIDSQSTRQINYEYNEAGFVVKIFDGNTLLTTNILEKY